MYWSHTRPYIFGIVNCTPDSFSDGGESADVAAAVARGEELVAEGADGLDVGGESTRPGAVPVSAEEERARVIPVIRELARRHPAVPISVDTTKCAVAGEAIDAGAAIVNDVSGMRFDPAMPALCAAAGVAVVLMHSRGSFEELAGFRHASYGTGGEHGDGDDIATVEYVIRELAERVDVALEAGIARERIAIDPGIGFAKRTHHSLAVLAHLDRIQEMGYPILIGVSRKRLVGHLTGRSIAAERVAGTIGLNVAALCAGARLFRVHDVRENREALDAAAAVLERRGAR